MNKEQKSILVEFVKKLSNEDLRYVGTRLNERYADDLAQVLDFLSKSEDVDGIFVEAHPEPAKAKCDAASQLALEDMEEFIKPLLDIHKVEVEHRQNNY